MWRVILNKLIPQSLKRKFVRIYILYKNKSLHLAAGAKVGYKSIFEGENSIGSDSCFVGKMGYGSYIACNSQIYGNIGRFTSIGSFCRVAFGRHPITYPFVSTSPMFFSLLQQTGKTFVKKQCFEEFKYANNDTGVHIIIGNDCWIQTSVTIIGGVSIGDGAVVMAGSVVTKDVPPYAIVAGVPAKVIKYRYTSEDIEFLLTTRWWDKPIEWIRKNHEKICDFDKFKSVLTNH